MRHIGDGIRLIRNGGGLLAVAAAGLVLLAGLPGTVGCGAAPHGATVAAEQVRQGLVGGFTKDHHVDIPGSTLRLPTGDWTPMENEYPWAARFLATAPRNQAVSQVVTVFKLPMTDDRRSGERISPNEYLEMFATNPGEVTVLVRLDKQAYWVLSREVFAYPSMTSWGTKAELHAAQIALQPQIDTTRYLLQTFGTDNASS